VPGGREFFTGGGGGRLVGEKSSQGLAYPVSVTGSVKSAASGDIGLWFGQGGSGAGGHWRSRAGIGGWFRWGRRWQK
jgi:hypothetical protein